MEKITHTERERVMGKKKKKMMTRKKNSQHTQSNVTVTDRSPNQVNIFTAECNGNFVIDNISTH